MGENITKFATEIFLLLKLHKKIDANLSYWM
jgi:hypothetical protein